MKKVFFFDIDGTLVDMVRGLKKPSIYTKYAIDELIKNGDLVFIATGRFIANVPDSIKDLNPSGYILSNGACIEYQGKQIYSSYFDNELFVKLKEYCDKCNSLLTGECQEFIYASIKDQRLHDYLTKWDFDYVEVKDEYKGINFNKCNIIFDTREDALKFEKDFKGLVDYRCHSADPKGVSYDVGLFGINKGTGVNKVSELLNIDPNDTYCFCDGMNDFELAKACKYSFVMNNGDEELKKIAYDIADDVLDEGIYKKLVELKLINKME